MKKAKGGPGSTNVYVPTNTVRSTPKGTQKQSSGSVPSASATESSAQNQPPESATAEVEGICLPSFKVMNIIYVDGIVLIMKQFGSIRK